VSRSRRAIAGAVVALALTAAGNATAGAQAPAAEHGSQILGELIAGLGSSVRVLMIGAHPDDEDTHLLTWLARGQHVETAYLSLTRGEGGQNLIGSELGPALGEIRSAELLAARRIDGGHQYFTRAIDFGFSKTADETFTRWPREGILRDAVRTIRVFRPHVIVSVWSGTPKDGHGHHQASGLLAREAFLAANDTVRFPIRDTQDVAPWTPLKFYVGARGDSASATLTMDAGAYDPLLGRSYAEIAGLSRSQHASQGTGTAQPKGRYPVYVRFDTAVAGPGAPDRSLFDGIDSTWARFTAATIGAPARVALDSLVGAIAVARARTDYANPAAFTLPLAGVLRWANSVRASAPCASTPLTCRGVQADLVASIEALIARASRALVESAGVVVEATADQELVALGDTVPVTIALYNRGGTPVTVVGGSVLAEGRVEVITSPPVTVAAGTTVAWGGSVSFPRISTAWWLDTYRSTDTNLYSPTMQEGGIPPAVRPTRLPAAVVLGEDRVHATDVTVDLTIGGVSVKAMAGPIVRKVTDPARGERRIPIAGVPRISLLVEREIAYASVTGPIDRIVRVYVFSAAGVEQRVTVTLAVPPGLRVDTASRIVTVKPRSTTSVFFRMRGTLKPGLYRVTATAIAEGRRYDRGFVPVVYRHLDPIRYFRTAAFELSAVDVHAPRTLSVAYVKGVGDVGDAALEQLGVPVTVVDPSALPFLDALRFTTLVIGPRAFASNPDLVATASSVQAFARAGGTVVVQYGQYEMQEPGILPYPITLERPADRVTNEHASVRVLDSTSRLMHYPNTIVGADFDRWVQERALYMPRTYDARWHPLLAMHDPDEPDNGGAILSASVGKGMYIYTTLSFFRQLGAGNPGAARLFVNLLSAGLPRTPPTP
jgi:LmbE family N-acetylglucosaminyl deacetylase